MVPELVASTGELGVLAGGVGTVDGVLVKSERPILSGAASTAITVAGPVGTGVTPTVCTVLPVESIPTFASNLSIRATISGNTSAMIFLLCWVVNWDYGHTFTCGDDDALMCINFPHK